MTPRSNQTRVLRKYLRFLQIVRSELRADCSLRPFQESADCACRFAVDWSEVHAYIFQGPAPAGDILHALFPPDLVEAVHLAGLTVLFERLPDQILLLPPYMQELRNFVDTVKAQLALVELINRRYHDDQVNRLYPQSTVAAQLEAFASEWIKGRTGRRRAPREDEVLEFIRTNAEQSLKTDIDSKQLREWLNAEFGIVYLLSRIFSSDCMHALETLLYGSDASDPRLSTLHDLYPHVRWDHDSMKRHALMWHAALRDAAVADRSQKKEEARHWDAVALQYVATLNSDMALSGEQLLFVSRGRDLASVCEDHPSRFVCTLGPYSRSDRDYGPPLCIRGWYHFFELGLAMSAVEAGGDLLAVLDERLSAVGTQLEWLDAGTKTSSQIYRQCERELRNEARKNCEVFASTLRTDTPVRSRPTRKQDLLALFVRHVTAAPEFEADRQHICRTVERRLVEIEHVLDLFYTVRDNPSVDNRGFVDLVAATIKRLPDRMLRGLADDAPKQQLLVSLKEALSKSSVPTPLSQNLVARLKRIQPSDEVSSADNSVSILIRILAAHAVGASRMVKYLVSMFEEMLPSRLSLVWVLIRIAQADSALVEDPDPRSAASLLQESWFVIRDDVGPEPSIDEEVTAMVLLNSWLLISLDRLDQSAMYGLGQSEEQESVSDLELVLDQMASVCKRYTISKWPTHLKSFGRAVANNQLYARVHLSWFSWRRRDARPEESRSVSCEDKYNINDAVTKSLIRTLQTAYKNDDSNASEADTLGLSLLMKSLHNPRRRTRAAEAEARRLLQIAAQADDRRTQQAAETHLEFLEREVSFL